MAVTLSDIWTTLFGGTVQSALLAGVLLGVGMLLHATWDRRQRLGDRGVLVLAAAVAACFTVAVYRRDLALRYDELEVTTAAGSTYGAAQFSVLWIAGYGLVLLLLGMCALLVRRVSLRAAVLAVTVLAPLVFAAGFLGEFALEAMPWVGCAPQNFPGRPDWSVLRPWLSWARSHALLTGGVAGALSLLALRDRALLAFLGSSRGLRLGGALLALGVVGYASTRPHARAAAAPPGPTLMAFVAGHDVVEPAACVPLQPAAVLYADTFPPKLDGRPMSRPETLANDLATLKRNSHILYPSSPDRGIAVVPTATEAPSRLRAYLEVVRAAAPSRLQVVGQRVREYPGTPYFPRARREACAIELRYAPDAPSLYDYASWGDAVAAAGAGVLTVRY